MMPGESVVITGNVCEGSIEITANDGNATIQSTSNNFRTQASIMRLGGTPPHVLSVISIGDTFATSAPHFHTSGRVAVSSPKMEAM